ncbi:hypothetical protein SEPL_380 [Salmonella phage SE_PL]|nr:hypothetical protein [Salmonella enterica]EBU7866115.1 hypothetical protein [Salmonella enterica subsp. enterica serovar Kentucky]ECV9083975.1 hypothetical protein [Salmonella enterica subsp. enterica serovar Infantis]QCW18713.1 hypothetical protein 7t3_0192 [Salmonella phage 7t3]QIG62993.1 hypothetical protein SEPL_380 [Salmonella phage SE_PL]WNV47148.1 hypothetical protein [Klebsiella phage fENko-Kae01]
MIVQVTLKGLKPGEDDYETHVATISGLTMDEIDGNILSYIYEWRNANGYYKMKYIHKEVISCDN